MFIPTLRNHTSSADLANRFTTLSTLQPGIMLVYEALLSPGGATLRTQPVPASLVGKTYKEARRSFSTTLICGYIRDGQVQLLAKDSKNEVLKEGDKLVTLSLTIKPALSSPDSKEIFENASAKLMARGAVKKAQQSSKKKIIVVAMGVQVGGVHDWMRPLSTSYHKLLGDFSAGGAVNDSRVYYCT